jgi:hypothetical protein
MRKIDQNDLRDIARGAAILGTGGGGDPYIGTLTAIRALEQYGTATVISIDELPDDELIILPFLIGSPTTLLEKFPTGPEMIQAYRSLERALGCSPSALMAAEIGGVNSLIPLALGSMLDLPVVDGDAMGRAYPEVQLVTLTLYGINASPFALADERGNHVVLNTVDNFWAERIGRAVVIEFGAICAGADFPITVAQARDAAVLGSLSYAQRIGCAVREAHDHKVGPVDAVIETTGGVLLFSGKISDVQRRVERGWTIGKVVLDGIDDYRGTEMIVHFQNENLLAVKDGLVQASVPDLITILDLESGDAITTEHLKYGYRVVVLGIPCDGKWRSPKGLELGGPQHFGYDIEYRPLESVV